MELLIYIVEIFVKFFSMYGTEGTLLAFGLVLLFFIKQTKTRDEETDKILEKLVKSQNDMKKEYRDQFSEIEAALTTINNQQKENNLMTLRSIVTNSSLPDEYRLKNYDIYVEMGGNSWLNKYVNEEILNKQGE